MKYQVLFSLKNNEKIFMNVVCCSDWRFKSYYQNWAKIQVDLPVFCCSYKGRQLFVSSFLQDGEALSQKRSTFKGKSLLP